MRTTRRDFIAKITGTIGAIGLVIVSAPGSARACLRGTWVIRCRNGHDDTVTEGTCQHICENDRCREQVFSGNVVTIVCPAGHANRIDTGDLMESYRCAAQGCGRECRRDLDTGDSNNNNKNKKIKDSCPRC